jgi:PepSY-associated TM region
MSIARIASWVHKWLALLIGLQILFWVGSGLFFAVYPITQVRSEHLIQKTAPRPIDVNAIGAIGTIRNAAGQTPTKIAVENRAVGQVIVAEFAEGPPALFDAASLKALSPVDAATAARIAQAHVTVKSTPASVNLVEKESPEYRGALPAWRVQFRDHGLAVYVAQNTGAVTARRSDLWRTYDALWALHIMDWRDHENFNHPLLIITAALTLISVIAGIVLLPFRIRFRQSETQGTPH